jgi:hypothetical protein
MRKQNKNRSKAPRRMTGPRVGVVVKNGAATVRVLEDGERESLPRATVKANNATRSALQSAAEIVTARLRANMRKPMPVIVAV